MRTLLGLTLFFVLAQTPTSFQRGEVVRVKNETRIPTVRVVAVPGDRVKIDNSGVYVNTEKVAWVSGEELASLPKPWEPELMARDQYLVVGSHRSESEGLLVKGEYWAYIGLDSLERFRPQ